MKTASLLLAGTALVALGFHSLPAGAVEQSFIVAQATPKPDAEPPRGGRAQQRQERQEQRQQQAPAVRQQQPAPQTQAPAPQTPAPAAQTQTPAPQINRSVQQEAPRLQSAPPPPPRRTSSVRRQRASAMTDARAPIVTIAGRQRSSSPLSRSVPRSNRPRRRTNATARTATPTRSVTGKTRTSRTRIPTRNAIGAIRTPTSSVTGHHPLKLRAARPPLPMSEGGSNRPATPIRRNRAIRVNSSVATTIPRRARSMTFGASGVKSARAIARSSARATAPSSVRVTALSSATTKRPASRSARGASTSSASAVRRALSSTARAASAS